MMCCAGQNGYAFRRSRRSFTLIELLISIAMITVLASTILFALYGVMESTKETRTRSQVAKLHELIMTKWEGYRTRAIRFSPTTISNKIGASPTSIQVAQLRLWALRELMRLELPERVTDVGDSPVIVPAPAVWTSYRRAAVAAVGATWYQTTQPPAANVPYWTTDNQGAECLYLIISNMREGDSTAIDFFMQTEIGDLDQDGMKEILDGFGRPMGFLRWAPGFCTVMGTDGNWGKNATDDDNQAGVDDLGERGYPGTDDYSELQNRDATIAPDPFDPLKLDWRWGVYLTTPTPPPLPHVAPYALFPLIISGGRDGVLGIDGDFDSDTAAADFQPFRYSTTKNPVSLGADPNDPYHIRVAPLPRRMFGHAPGIDADDNISNHLLQISQ
jgi:type II secretory pathway pseudopilin PulG